MKHLFLFLAIWGILTVSLQAQSDLWGPEGAWPMFQANAQHTGQSDYVGPQVPNLMWSQKIADEIDPRISPIVSYGDEIYIGSVGSNFYAIDKNGNEKWHYKTGGPITSTAVLGRYIYFAAGDTLYAVDYNGQLQWSYEADSPVNSPIITGYPPKLFFCSEQKFYGLEPSTGYENFHTDHLGAIAVGPAATSDLEPSIYIATLGDPWRWYDFRIYSFTSTGTRNWKLEKLAFEPGGIKTVPTIADDGTVYAITTWSPGWQSRLYAIDSSGKEKWTYNGEFFYSSPAIANDGTIYVGSNDGLLALNPNGRRLKWKCDVGSVKYSSPAIGADGTIYVGTDAGKICALDPDGLVKWEFKTGDGPLGSPAISATGVLYIVSKQGILYAFGSTNVPVELCLFSASVKGNDVELLWETTSETNNFGFNIERSRDKKVFAEIGSIKGQGTSAAAYSYFYKDCGLTNGIYYYRLKQIDVDGSFIYSEVVAVTIKLPKIFHLAQNYPNPFNPTTAIEFFLPIENQVKLAVCDICGCEIEILIDSKMEAGNHRVTFDAANYAAGVYFYRLQADNQIFQKKMTLVK